MEAVVMKNQRPFLWLPSAFLTLMLGWERGRCRRMQSRPRLGNSGEINREEPVGSETAKAGSGGTVPITALSSGVQWGMKRASLGQHQRKGEIRPNGGGISEAQDTWRAGDQSPISLWLPTYGSVNPAQKITWFFSCLSSPPPIRLSHSFWRPKKKMHTFFFSSDLRSCHIQYLSVSCKNTQIQPVLKRVYMLLSNTLKNTGCFLIILEQYRMVKYLYHKKIIFIINSLKIGNIPSEKLNYGHIIQLNSYI